MGWPLGAVGRYLWERGWNEEGDEGEKGRRWIFFLVYRVLSLRGLRGEERWWHTLYICMYARACARRRWFKISWEMTSAACLWIGKCLGAGSLSPRLALVLLRWMWKGGTAVALPNRHGEGFSPSCSNLLLGK